jgi:hypothetical protein
LAIRRTTEAIRMSVAMRFCRVAGGNLTRRLPQIRT